MALSTTTLVFDGDCGFCTRAVGWIERLDRHGRVRAVACQMPGVAEAHGLTAMQCAEAVWAFTPDGRRHRGASAANAVLGTALGTRLPLRIYALPGSRALQDRAYDWVAANRRRFPGATPWCRAHSGCEPVAPPG